MSDSDQQRAKARPGSHAQLQAFDSTLQARGWADPQVPFPPAWTDTYADIFGMVTGLVPLAALRRLPDPPAKRQVMLDQARVTVTGAVDASFVARCASALRELIPWRKGPYTLYGTEISTPNGVRTGSGIGWRRISLLAGRRLTVSVGRVHLWRTRGAGAYPAVGLDPTLNLPAALFARWRICWAPRRMPG